MPVPPAALMMDDRTQWCLCGWPATAGRFTGARVRLMTTTLRCVPFRSRFASWTCFSTFWTVACVTFSSVSSAESVCAVGSELSAVAAAAAARRCACACRSAVLSRSPVNRRACAI